MDMIVMDHVVVSSWGILVLAAWEAALGLSLLVLVSNTYGTDYVQNLNLLQC